MRFKIDYMYDNIDSDVTRLVRLDQDNVLNKNMPQVHTGVS